MPSQIENFWKETFDVTFSDHSAIFVDISVDMKKVKKQKWISRDMRKLRANPHKLVIELNKVDWEFITDSSSNDTDVDDMVDFWTKSIIGVVDFLAPKTERSLSKEKKIKYPDFVVQKLQKLKEMRKELDESESSGCVDKDLAKAYRKHKNYCSRLQKKAINEGRGNNITKKSTINQIWKEIAIIFRPEKFANNRLKIEVNGNITEDPKIIAEAFVDFFKKKVDKLAESIKSDPNFDPLEPLRKKHENSDLKFSFQPVDVPVVKKILKELKKKTSCGFDDISSEILKMGADALAEPLCYIINKSLETGKYPTTWKEGKICPIYKKKNRKFLENYRPVSLLCVSGMVLERVCCMQMEEFFESNNLLQDYQFGFRQYKSTTSELLTLFHKLMEAKEEGKEIALILFDLSSAFDTIDHDILLQKLSIYGFSTLATEWISSYLRDRQHRVSVSGQLSKSVTVNRGTPQGSRLSPLLFLILMSDLNLHTNGSLSNFADDMQLIVFEETEEQTRKKASEEAAAIIKFFEGVKLCNNADKAALIYNSKGKHKDIEMEVGGEILKSKESEKLLGLKISSDLNWSTHVDELCYTLKQRLGMIARIKDRVSGEKLQMISEAIFMSTVRYGMSLFTKPKYEFNHLEQPMDPNIAKIQVVHNDLLRVIYGKSRQSHTNMQKLREKNKIMSINQLSIYHVAMDMFGIINNSSSDFLHEEFKIEKKRYELRCNDDGQVRVPDKMKKSCTGFGYIGPKMWNYLPGHIRKTTIRDIFKEKMKDWIWEFIPPV